MSSFMQYYYCISKHVDIKSYICIRRLANVAHGIDACMGRQHMSISYNSGLFSRHFSSDAAETTEACLDLKKASNKDIMRVEHGSDDEQVELVDNLFVEKLYKKLGREDEYSLDEISASRKRWLNAIGKTVLHAFETYYGTKANKAYYLLRSQKAMLVGDATIIQNLKLAAAHEVSLEQLQNNIWMIYHEPSILDLKFKKITKPPLFNFVNEGVGFCRLSMELIDFSKKAFAYETHWFPNHQNRMYYIAELLSVPVSLLLNNIYKCNNIIKMDMSRIEKVINTCKKYDVRMEDLAKNLSLFANDLTLIEKRLSIAHEMGLQHPKPWFTERFKSISLDVLKLHKRLFRNSPTEDELNALIDIRSYLIRKNINVAKAEERIHFLVSQNFTYDEIQKNVSILAFSKKYLEERLDRLHQIGFHPKYLQIVGKNEEAFEDFCKRLKNRELPLYYVAKLQYHKTSSE